VHPVPPPLQLSSVASPAEQRARYLQLMKQGWNNNDACRAVGICRKTEPVGDWDGPHLSGNGTDDDIPDHFVIIHHPRDRHRRPHVLRLPRPGIEPLLHRRQPCARLCEI